MAFPSAAEWVNNFLLAVKKKSKHGLMIFIIAARLPVCQLSPTGEMVNR